MEWYQETQMFAQVVEMPSHTLHTIIKLNWEEESYIGHRSRKERNIVA
jgi:hypothetical protein